MLYGSKTWSFKEENMIRQGRNGAKFVRWHRQPCSIQKGLQKKYAINQDKEWTSHKNKEVELVQLV